MSLTSASVLQLTSQDCALVNNHITMYGVVQNKVELFIIASFVSISQS